MSTSVYYYYIPSASPTGSLTFSIYIYTHTLYERAMGLITRRDLERKNPKTLRDNDTPSILVVSSRPGSDVFQCSSVRATDLSEFTRSPLPPHPYINVHGSLAPRRFTDARVYITRNRTFRKTNHRPPLLYVNSLSSTFRHRADRKSRRTGFRYVTVFTVGLLNTEIGARGFRTISSRAEFRDPGKTLRSRTTHLAALVRRYSRI